MTMVQVSSQAATRTCRQINCILTIFMSDNALPARAHTLDEAQIKAFALQFDPQPFHTDKQAAERGDIVRSERPAKACCSAQSRGAGILWPARTNIWQILEMSPMAARSCGPPYEQH